MSHDPGQVEDWFRLVRLKSGRGPVAREAIGQEIGIGIEPRIHDRRLAPHDRERLGVADGDVETGH